MKKLVLNKETVANLTSEAMNHMIGGGGDETLNNGQQCVTFWATCELYTCGCNTINPDLTCTCPL